jgi:prophage regulatory protein
MQNRIVRLRTVIDRTGLSRSTIYRKIAEGTFPPQLRISINGAGWSETELDRWVASPSDYRAGESVTG